MVSENSDLINKYYKSNKMIMSLVGFWPYQPRSTARVMSFIWLFQNISIIIPEIFGLVKIRHDTNNVIESIALLMFNAVVEIKFWSSIFNKRKVKAIIERIQDDWQNLRDKKEIEILTQYALFGKLLSILYMSMVLVTVWVYLLLFLTPLVLDVIQPLNESRPLELIFSVDYFVDEDKYFTLIMVHAYVTTLIGSFCLIASDTFYAISVQHACGLFAILGYCEDINDAYSDSFFYIMGLNMLMLSLSGVLIILMWGDFHNIIRYGIFIGAQIFHLFCYSFQGQMLLDESSLISDYIYNSDWYQLSLRTQKLVLFMLMRSNRSIKLTAKLFLMSLENFSNVVKKSMSYFTVLKSTR